MRQFSLNGIHQHLFSAIFSFSVLSLMCLFSSFAVNAQTYTPLNPNITNSDDDSPNKNTSVKDRLGRLLGNNTIATLNSGADPFPRCVVMPTIAEVATLGKFRERLYTATQAGNAGILAVGGKFEFSGSQLLYISDYTRAKGCPTADGKNEVLYGQVIRTILTLSEWNAKGAISLPILAADATLNSKGHTITIEHYGFGGPKITALIAQINGKTFNVETFGEYKRIQSELINLMDAADSIKSIERVGIVSTETDTSLQDASIIAFALQQIKDGKSCVEAKNKIKTIDASTSRTIENTYNAVMGKTGTEAPTPGERDRARSLLAGFKVSN